MRSGIGIGMTRLFVGEIKHMCVVLFESSLTFLRFNFFLVFFQLIRISLQRVLQVTHQSISKLLTSPTVMNQSELKDRDAQPITSVPTDKEHFIFRPSKTNVSLKLDENINEVSFFENMDLVCASI